MLTKRKKYPFYGEDKCKVYPLKMLGRPMKGRSGQQPKAARTNFDRFTKIVILVLFIELVLIGAIERHEQPREITIISPVSQPTESFEQKRIRQIRTYLEKHNSPLAEYAINIVINGVSNGFDPVLTVAIAKRESSLGRMGYAYNYWGIGGSHNFYHFKTPLEGIEFFSNLIGESSYYKEFRESHDYIDLAKRYCPPKNSKGEFECDTQGWAIFVEKVVNEIDSL
jgi:hypothetical protein